MRVAAGIVTYEPEIARLTENISSIHDQVSFLFIFDNGSSNVGEIEALTEHLPRVTLMLSPTNQGIAEALNRLVDAASRGGYEWLVTLDQDSIAAPGMVHELYRVASMDPEVAMVTPYIVDRNKLSISDYLALNLVEQEKFRQAARRGAITSGSLSNVPAILSVGAFDASMFIDYVDYDLNARLMLAGRKVVRANRTYLLHEVGKARATWLWVPRRSMAGRWSFERFYAFGHSPFRCYYKARNRIVYTRRYLPHFGVTHEGVFQLPQQLILTILFEDQRAAKLRAFIAGIRDGIKSGK